MPAPGQGKALVLLTKTAMASVTTPPMVDQQVAVVGQPVVGNNQIER
jgi:hypothetical protein